MGCAFCASTIGGLVRNLTAGEIINQIIFAEQDIKCRISNVVIMGIGEPLDNYDNIIKFLHNVNHPDGLNIGYRHITVSSCGLVNKIYDLAEENLPITLTISLHAPNDTIRNKIMPVSHKWRIDELIEACRVYTEKTTRRISFEYSLIHGVNDSEKDALEVASLIRKLHAHVNLIPVNNVRETGFRKGSVNDINKFRDTLIANGVNTTIRRELGSDISASCGQLRKKHAEKNEL